MGSYSGNSSQSIKFGSNNYSRWDIGYIVGGGIQYGNVLLNAYYDLGLTNILNFAPIYIQNQVFSISIGYMFGH
jgi:hypothetical protein